MKTIERIITTMIETIVNAAVALNRLVNRVIFRAAFMYGNIRGLMKYYEIDWKDIVAAAIVLAVIISGYAVLLYTAYITNC